MTWHADDYRPVTRLILAGLALLALTHFLPWRSVESPDGPVAQTAFEVAPTLAPVNVALLLVAGALFAAARAPGLRPPVKEFLRFLGQGGVTFVVLMALAMSGNPRWPAGVRPAHGVWVTLAVGWCVLMLGGGLLRAAHGQRVQPVVLRQEG
jgi:hypothetical protein